MKRESNPGHFTATGQHSRPLHVGNGAKALIGSHIPLLAYLLCLGQGSGGVGDGIGSVDSVWQEQPQGPSTVDPSFPPFLPR
jgi:hypothetical protein